MEYYAHIRQDETDTTSFQTVEEHLRGTAALCREFADAFGAGADGEFVGLSHDMGKCTIDFQNRLLHNGPIVDHATAGALACASRNYVFLAACVAAHHGGLPDFGNMHGVHEGDATLYGRLKKGINARYLENCGESGVVLPHDFRSDEPGMRDKLRASFWTRMLYSCLVDADFLDTEKFMQGECGRGGADDIETLFAKLEKYIAKWQNPNTELNRLRCEILNICMEAGNKAKGIYTLTVPTGGGKTISSMAFALRHAAVHKMQRVIYVIPYTSIIDQNAGVFSEILGSGNVLEHHSGVQFNLSDRASPEDVRKSLAIENWDMPVVVTTAVQFFESIYSNRASKCRKLHNLANSVIIFDEAQMLPLSNLRPCVAAMASLVRQFNSTVVLCTATQPSLNDLFHIYAPDFPIKELCPQTEDVYQKFCRVTFNRKGVLEDSVLAEELSRYEQVLCVVNTRKAAQQIFALLPREESYHLSTLMVPAQRQRLLCEIRDRLANGAPCRVVSTSLIEAGVDVDFPIVYREMAGLDSILQAAGRCNREGKRPVDKSIVTIFERTGLPAHLFCKEISASQETLAKCGSPNLPETMNYYFSQLRDFSGKALDKADVITIFEKGIDGCEMPFRTVAEKFHLIDKNNYTIYIPYCDEGMELVNRLRAGVCSKELYRRLGRYAVSVYKQHFQALYDAGALLTAKEVITLDDDSAILADMTLYSESIGLSMEPESGKAEFI